MNRPTDAEQLTREQIERIRATFRMFGVGEEQRSRLSVLCDMALASLSASAPLSETPARAPVSATAPQFMKIGALHRPRSGGVHFLQDVFSIPLAVHGTLDVYMATADSTSKREGKDG